MDSKLVMCFRLDPSGERWMVPGLKKYACEFSLDPNTAHRLLLLSEDHRSVTRVEEEQPYPHHQHRFIYWQLVLSSSGLRGRCYWEVDWSASKFACFSVSYRGISRTGAESGFGNNDQSWALYINDRECYGLHNSNVIGVPDRVGGTSGRVGVPSGRVGVFLDWEGGAVTFYEVLSGGELHHLHTFNTSFTEELFPGFGFLHPSSTLSLVKL